MKRLLISLVFAFHAFGTIAAAQEPVASVQASSPAGPAMVETPVATASPEAPADSTPTVIPVESPTQRTVSVFDGQTDMLSLTTAMAESSFRLNPSFENRVDLLHNLSRLIDIRCMSSLHATLVYTSPPKDKYCQDLIEYGLSLDPFLPDAVCARQGIDSPACREAFSRQKASNSLPFANTTDLMTKFLIRTKLTEAKNSTAVLPLQSEMNSARSAYSSKKTQEAKDRLEKVLISLLDASCSEYLLVPNPSFEEERKAQDEALARSDSAQRQQEGASTDLPVFKDMLKKLSSTPQAEPTIAFVSNRIRLISSHCMEAISNSLQILPDFPRAICHRDGFFTPSCINAIRRQQSSARGNNQKGASPSSPLAEF